MNVYEAEIIYPDNIVVAHLCNGYVTIFSQENDDEAIKDYVRMVRAGVLKVDASPLLPTDTDTQVPEGISHVTEVVFYHEALHISSGSLNKNCCSH
jgi:hypothetical protein